MILLKELKEKMVLDLASIYPEKESQNLIDWLVESVTGYSSRDLALEPGLSVDDIMQVLLTDKFEELMNQTPIQYVTGTAYFLGFEFEVNTSVLIPRPETEELVLWMVNDHRGMKGIRVLDIGTGSGCIIISIGKLLPGQELTAIDISSQALEIAGLNADKFDMSIRFLEMDILDKTKWPEYGEFDVIISNPPYVRNLEKQWIRDNVLKYEPQSALFVPDDDPLLFYRAIAGLAKYALSENGRIYLEINESLSKEVTELYSGLGFGNVVLARDMNGKSRHIRILH